MVFIVIGLFLFFTMISVGVWLYFKIQTLTKADVIFTSIPKGYIGAISNIKDTGAPQKYFSSPLRDGKRISSDGLVFDPKDSSSSDIEYLKETEGRKGIFTLGFPGYSVRSEFTDPKLKHIEKRLVTDEKGDQNYSYFLVDYDPRRDNNKCFPEEFMFGFLSDNNELIDGSTLDIFIYVTCGVDDMDKLNAAIGNGLLGRLTQTAPAGKTNDFVKSKRFKNYEDIQSWETNSNLPGESNDLFERIKSLNDHLPGYGNKGFVSVLGIRINSIVVEGVAITSEIANAAKEDSIAKAQAKAAVSAAEGRSKVKEIDSKAEADAIERVGAAKNKVDREAIEIFASKGEKIAEHQAIKAQAGTLTTLVTGSNSGVHLGINADGPSSKKEEKGHDSEDSEPKGKGGKK